MLYHNVQVMAHSLRFFDAVSVAAVCALSIWFGLTGDQQAFLPQIQLFTLTLLIAFLVIAERMRIYFARRTENLLQELLSVCEAALYAVSIAVAVTEIWSRGLPPFSYLHALGAALVVVIGLRFGVRLTLRRLRRSGNDYRVWLIVGQNDRSAQIAETILAHPHYGIRIEEIGDVVDEGQPSTPPPRFRQGALARVRCRVLHDCEAIRELVATRVIDEVVVMLPVRSCYDRIREIFEICRSAGISVKLEPQLFAGSSTALAHVGAIPMVTYFSGPSNYHLLMAKRLIDFFAALAGLLVLAPLLAALAIAVKVTSPGPIFFVQTRVGLHGRHFRMVKFRSMVKDAVQQRDSIASLNERDGTAFKVRNDTRITPLGRWMRKYHLDELPQLWNVLVGDMSLVGPRPLPVDEAFGDEWWQRRRLSMPPGMTCFWQVADDPNMPFKEWMELDMLYIDRWSIWLDLKLIAQTVVTVSRGRGW